MANIPKSMVLRPAISQDYVCNSRWQVVDYLFFLGQSVYEPLTKIELEPAKNGSNSYHLRFPHSNRYWAKEEDGIWIVAASKQPEEDTSNPSCTLFTPTITANGVLRLTHLQSGSQVRTDEESCAMYLDQEDGNGPSNTYDFKYVNWESLVILPILVVFKSDNGKLLKGMTHGGNYLQFSSTDKNDGYSIHRVNWVRDGHIRIKSEYYNKFWRRDSTNYILGDSRRNSADTLFWPVKVDDRTIALRNAGNKKFVKRYTDGYLINCLSALASDITPEARMEVGKPVAESEVYDVEYRVEDALVFDEQPYSADVVTVTNELDTESTFTINAGYEFTESSFNNNYTLKLGGNTTIRAVMPRIVEQGRIDYSVKYNGTLEWGATITEKKTAAEASITIQVPPKSRATAKYVGTMRKCSVPFSYTLKDKRSDKDDFETYWPNDGIFYGTNYYNFHFEQPVVEPL